MGKAVKKQYSYRLYSPAEVAQHNSSDSMWVIIHGRVFDVHAFLEDHPGGPEILSTHAGKDATQEFEETFHSPAARTQLSDYVIGGVEGYAGTEDAHLGKKKATTTQSGGSTATTSAGGMNPLLISAALVAVAALVYVTVQHFT